MGVVTYDMEVSSPIPASKMFKAFVLDADNLIPKILPQAIKSVETIEGDGGPGSIKIIHFGEGSQFKTAKHKIDGIDKDNFSYNYSVIEGDALMGVLEKVSYEIKFEASSDGGCTIKNSSKYYTIGDIEIKEDQIKAGKEKAIGMFKAVEGYLVANPDAY